MMTRTIYLVLSVVAVFAAAGETSAQKYPERRTTRQGTRLYDKGDFPGAEAAYRRASEINPELKEAQFNLGNALWRQEKGQDAAAVWMDIATDSLAPIPLISAASYNLGNASLASQQLDAAIEAYKTSLRLNPDDMEAKFNLAYAQKMKQQQEEQNQDQDQNQEQNQDQNQDGGGQNDPQQDDGDENEGQNDPQQGDGDGNGQDGGEGPEGDEGNEPPPPPSEQGQGQGEAKIDPRTAEQMLDAMQAAEDDTREKVNAKEVQVGAKSGKNW